MPKEKQNPILREIMWHFVAEFPVHAIVYGLTTNQSENWSSIIKMHDNNGYFELIADSIADIEDAEFSELLAPLLAEKLAEELGAKEVTIKW